MRLRRLLPHVLPGWPSANPATVWCRDMQQVLADSMDGILPIRKSPLEGFCDNICRAVWSMASCPSKSLHSHLTAVLESPCDNTHRALQLRHKVIAKSEVSQQQDAKLDVSWPCHPSFDPGANIDLSSPFSG